MDLYIVVKFTVDLSKTHGQPTTREKKLNPYPDPSQTRTRDMGMGLWWVGQG